MGEDNDDEAIIDLATSLISGKGMPVDLPKARMWLETAQQLGVKGADEGLEWVDEKMKHEKADDDFILDDPDELW